MKKKKAILIGAHTSTAGGIQHALLEGREIGATTIQLFTSNQRQWKGRPLTPQMIEAWERTLKETGLSDIMSHDSYLINLGGPRQEILEMSRHTFQEEVKRCALLGIKYLNFHPGSSLDGDVQECLDRIVESLLLVKPVLEQGSTRLLLETTAGQGSTVGHRFEQLDYIIRRVKNALPIGVCIDTCHIFAAGYPLKTAEECEKTLAEFDRTIGLQNLYAFHLNDSLMEFGSRKDRHAALGKGQIGWDCFSFLMTDPRTCDLPKYLETPGPLEVWKEEIKKLKEMAGYTQTT